MSDTPFVLDPRLEADSGLIADLSLGQVRLLNDARFAWLLLIPRRPDLTEITDLPREMQIALLDEINLVADAVNKTAWPSGTPEKLNVAALGNQVRQLHLHIIGRRSDDAAWPGPVWGVGAPQPYSTAETETLRAQLVPMFTQL